MIAFMLLINGLLAADIDHAPMFQGKNDSLYSISRDLGCKYVITLASSLEGLSSSTGLAYSVRSNGMKRYLQIKLKDLLAYPPLQSPKDYEPGGISFSNFYLNTGSGNALLYCNTFTEGSDGSNSSYLPPNYQPGYTRLFLFKPFRKFGLPLTGFIKCEHRNGLAINTFSPYEAVHLSRTSRSVWIGRLNGTIFHASRYSLATGKWLIAPPITLTHKMKSLPPYVFCKSSNVEIFMLHEAWYSWNLHSNRVKKLPGDCPFQFLPGAGISIYRKDLGTKLSVNIFDAHLHRHVGFTVDKTKPQLTPYLNQAFVGDGLLQLTQDGTFVAYRLSNLSKVNCSIRTEAIVNGRCLRWISNSDLGFFINEIGSLSGPKSLKEGEYDDIEPSLLSVIGFHSMPLQIMDSHEDAGGLPGYDNTWEYVLAPADYRAIQVPIWQSDAEVPAYDDSPTYQ